jgi:hypothetical protein
VPTLWTQDVSQNDKVFRVVSGAGGGSAGSWTITGVTVDNHQLTVAEMPAHSHTGDWLGNVGINFAGFAVPNQNSRNVADSTDSTGGDGTHNHGLTSDAAWRPAYIDVIIGTKDA